jgi:hypothetical protein
VACFHGRDGLKHMASVIVPAIYDPKLANVRFGVSSGAAAVGALESARRTGARTVVAILPDGGDRYLSDGWEAT